MPSIEFITIEVSDVVAAEAFYAAAFEVDDRVRLQESHEPSAGFRGFALSLLVSRPADVRALIDSAVDAGATVMKPAAKSLWGYGGVVHAPDGTIWTIASSSKKETGAATRQIEEVVLQLGVAEVDSSVRFYTARGFEVAKRYGRRYAEFDTGPVGLTLNKRSSLAKTLAVPADGTGSHRLLIGGTTAGFTDPDGFEWRAASDRA